MLIPQIATPAPRSKYLIPIGACLDIPTGFMIEGIYGEWLLVAGLAAFTGVVGPGNQFKTYLAEFMGYTACSRIENSTGSSYDTEINKHERHLEKIVGRIWGFGGENIFVSGRWVITDKNVYSGNEWDVIQKKFLESKIKNAKNLTVELPFPDRNGKDRIKIIIPTFTVLDSFTEFETDDVIEIQNKNELGESGANALHMRQGLAKTRFLMEAPRLNVQASNYLIMTAHIGDEFNMQKSGGGREVAKKQLKYLKEGEKIIGVTKKFTFLTHNCWACSDAKPIIDASGEGPEYPKDKSDKNKYEKDLNEVKLRILRGKSGQAGQDITIVVSQKEGVNPSLTEFHHLRKNGRYGLDGGGAYLSCSIYPEVKFTRNTIRGLIDRDPFLRRALNITSELCQASYLWREHSDLYVDPKELYEGLKELGYDWRVLLQTRGYPIPNNEQRDLHHLSTFDLLRMLKGLYVPFWMRPEDVPEKCKGFPHHYCPRDPKYAPKPFEIIADDSGSDD